MTTNRTSSAAVGLTQRRGVAGPALWACAGLLGLNLLLGISGVPTVRVADAQPGAAAQPSIDPPFNAAEQRKRMIEQLTQMNDRLARLESKLDKGLTVKVSEMPAITVNVPASK